MRNSHIGDGKGACWDGSIGCALLHSRQHAAATVDRAVTKMIEDAKRKKKENYARTKD